MNDRIKNDATAKLDRMTVNKTDKRKLMKSLAIHREVARHQIRRLAAYQIDHLSVLHFPYESQKALNISRIPYKLFRTDKPEVDKRRYKRFNKIHKNSYIVKPNISTDKGSKPVLVNITI